MNGGCIGMRSSGSMRVGGLAASATTVSPITTGATEATRSLTTARVPRACSAANMAIAPVARAVVVTVKVE